MSPHLPVAPPTLHAVAEAQARILAALTPLPAETVPLYAAVGRVLAEDVRSASTLPASPTSAMDGYAVRAADIAGAGGDAPVTLPVRGEVKAGEAPGAVLPPGEALRIMTGAPCPEGTDTVVRREDTEEHPDRVLVLVAHPVGTAVRRAGEDVSAGDVVLEAGARVRPVDIAVLAAAGAARVAVHRRPRVGVLSTGDELQQPGEPALPGRIVDANRPAVLAAVAAAGGDPEDLGIVRDDVDALRQRLGAAAASCDLVVSSAGVSVGDHDHVRTVVEELGSLDLWRVAMRPGKPLAVGRIGAVLFIGLPGNPVSAQVTFELFARPAVLALQGARHPHRRRSVARIAEAMETPAGLETYHRAVLSGEPGAIPTARLTGPQGSAILRSLALADCLVVLPASAEVVPAGTVVETIPLD